MFIEGDKYMLKIESKMICPINKTDGTFTTNVRRFEEIIPDLGREKIICNKCGWSTYPECKRWCKIINLDKS